MTLKEKILLGTSIISVGGAAIAGYYCAAYKQAVEFLVEGTRRVTQTTIYWFCLR